MVWIQLDQHRGERFRCISCFKFCCFLQTEDKPLLPIAMEGSVDRREWTLQHRKAADISLTPPQADLDADCLDVNVKGPGERRKKKIPNS